MEESSLSLQVLRASIAKEETLFPLFTYLFLYLVFSMSISG
jgi:hypothetical protein